MDHAARGLGDTLRGLVGDSFHGAAPMEIQNMFDGGACGWIVYLDFASKTSRGCDFMIRGEPYPRLHYAISCGLHASVTNGVSRRMNTIKV